jgi:integrase
MIPEIDAAQLDLTDPRALSAALPALADAGRAANQAAAAALFADYRARKAANTLARQDDGLNLCARFLAELGLADAPSGAALASAPAAWQGVTWGIVTAFARWLLRGGYAIGTVNVHLSTVKAYARLAMQAGAIPAGEYAAIRAVMGYGKTEGKRIDDGRERTRAGRKKAEAVSVTARQAAELKRQPDTPQGRRDRLLLCLLLDHGLRVGEVAGLTVADVDLSAGELRFYRPKVDKTQTHRLTPDTLRAARAYFDAGDAPALGPLLRSSRKGGRLAAAGMSAAAIAQRVRDLGAAGGLAGLSPHDLRHYWATLAARSGTPLDRLQDAGGWNSPAMPLRYVEAARIANQGVLLAGAEG